MSLISYLKTFCDVSFPKAEFNPFGSLIGYNLQDLVTAQTAREKTHHAIGGYLTWILALNCTRDKLSATTV